MYNETYDEYIRSILGYPPISSNNNYQSYNNQNTYNTTNDIELEKCYPEIYKIVYPMVTKKCSNVKASLTNEDIENMTDEIYYALEERNEIQLNINLTNDVRTSEINKTRTSTTKSVDKRPEVRISEKTGENSETREVRQFNRGLRDLIKILLIRELLNRPGRPPQHPRPPMPGSGGPRPPVRPPMRPPYGNRPGGTPFNREFETSSYDIFEY